MKGALNNTNDFLLPRFHSTAAEMKVHKAIKQNDVSNVITGLLGCKLIAVGNDK